jgi:hypothetical protein
MGFLPLVLAPLVPYQTVGTFIASILFVAGAATLIILPSMMTLLEGWLFPETESRAFVCKCATCIVTGIATVALVAINVHRFLKVGWTSLTGISLGVIALLVIVCTVVGRRYTFLPKPTVKNGGGKR